MKGRNSCGQVIPLLNDNLFSNPQHTISWNLEISRSQIHASDSQTGYGMSQRMPLSSHCTAHSLLPTPLSAPFNEHDHPWGFIPLYFTNVTTDFPAKVDEQVSDPSVSLPTAFGVMFYVVVPVSGTSN